MRHETMVLQHATVARFWDLRSATPICIKLDIQIATDKSTCQIAKATVPGTRRKPIGGHACKVDQTFPKQVDFSLRVDPRKIADVYFTSTLISSQEF